MDNANNSSIILGLNKQDQIKALRDVGFTDIADNATWSDIVNHMRWAGGLRDLQVATYLKTSLRDPSPQRSYFSEDQWQTMTVNERSKFVPFGVAIRAERMAFVLSLQNATSDSTIRFVWGPTNINVPGLKDFSNKNEGGCSKMLTARLIPTLFLHVPRSKGPAFLPLPLRGLIRLSLRLLTARLSTTRPNGRFQPTASCACYINTVKR